FSAATVRNLSELPRMINSANFELSTLAIFATGNDVTHAARQRGNGEWSSEPCPMMIFLNIDDFFLTFWSRAFFTVALTGLGACDGSSRGRREQRSPKG